MSIRLKMPPEDIGLCGKCSWSSVRWSVNTVNVQCHEFDEAIRTPVQRCTSFLAKDETTVREMKEIAWMVRTDNSGKVIGFAPPKKDKRDE